MELIIITAIIFLAFSIYTGWRRHKQKNTVVESPNHYVPKYWEPDTDNSIIITELSPNVDKTNWEIKWQMGEKAKKPHAVFVQYKKSEDSGWNNEAHIEDISLEEHKVIVSISEQPKKGIILFRVGSASTAWSQPKSYYIN